MRCFRYILLLTVLPLIAISCQRRELIDDDGYFSRVPGRDAIAFRAVPGETYLSEMTKAEAIGSVASLGPIYVSATTGPAGAEESSWVSEKFVLSGTKYSSPRVWPADADPGYHFYASNLVSSFDPKGMTVNVDCTKDAVVAYLPVSAYHEDNTLVFDHILSRIGEVVVHTDGGAYALSDVSVHLLPVNEGKYNIRTKEWTDLTSTCGPVELSAPAGGVTANDVYLIPGTYEVGANWTVTDADGVRSYHNAFTVVLQPGMFSRLELTLKGSEAGHLSMWALEDGTFTFSSSLSASDLSSVSYSLDEGATWVTVSNSGSPIGVTTPVVKAGRRVLWKGSGVRTGSGSGTCSVFSSTGAFTLSGNVLSMVYGDGFAGVTSIGSADLFKGLFAGSRVVNASALRLTLDSVPENAYSRMFEGCTLLEAAPSLPATSLSAGCYERMFAGCTSLSSVPDLPAAAVKTSSYAYMFQGCYALRKAPVLSAGSLAVSCYEGMFSGCVSLLDAPALPATTLQASCYSRMFQGCTAIMESPVLAAPVMVAGCYDYMFQGCSALVYVKCLASTVVSSASWLDGAHAGGVFVKKAGVSWGTGNDYIPSGWSVIEE